MLLLDLKVSLHKWVAEDLNLSKDNLHLSKIKLKELLIYRQHNLILSILSNKQLVATIVFHLLMVVLTLMQIILSIICISLAILDLWWWREKISILKISTVKWYLKFKGSSSCSEKSKERPLIMSYQKTWIYWLIKLMEHLLNWLKSSTKMRKEERYYAEICVLNQQLTGAKECNSRRQCSHQNNNKRKRLITININSNYSNSKCNTTNFNKSI